MIDVLTIILSVSTTIADSISNLFRIPGQFIRNILLSLYSTVFHVLRNNSSSLAVNV